jgi:SnoaL-like domain
MDDKSACAELIQAWAIYRDQGKWPQLLATFVPEGEIAVSWFSGSFREFVDRCRQSFEAGQRPPVAHWRRSCTTTAHRTRRVCTRATTLGWAARSRRPRSHRDYFLIVAQDMLSLRRRGGLSSLVLDSRFRGDEWNLLHVFATQAGFHGSRLTDPAHSPMSSAAATRRTRSA